MSEDTPCASCGLVNEPGRDFCQRCGEYLSWAPTQMVAAVPQAASAGDEATTTEAQTGDAQEPFADAGGRAADPPTAELSDPPAFGEHADGEHAHDGHTHGEHAHDGHAHVDAEGHAHGDGDVHAYDADEPPPAPGNVASAAAIVASDASAPTEAVPADTDAAADSANGVPPSPAPRRARTPGLLRRAAPKPRRAPPPQVPGGPATMPAITAPAMPTLADAGPPPPPETQSALPAAAQSPAATGDASLVLVPADPVVGAGGVPAVEAGALLTFRATIRNESQIVDNYDLAVLGLPEGWTLVSPATAFLVPLGSGRGDSELELRIDISPPRDHHSTAGVWTFELIALSRTHATVAARAIARFEVRPFQSWSVEVLPTVKAGRCKARYRTAVRNDGNAEQILWPTAIDDSGRLRAAYLRGRLTLAAGEVGADTLTLRPRFPRPVGRTIEHRVGVDVLSTEPELPEAELSPREKLAAKAREEAKKTAGGVKVGPRGVTLPRLRPPKFKNPLAKFKLDAGALARLRGGPADANAPVTARQVVFRQKPVVPLWVIGLILLLAVAALLLYLLLPQKTSVPSLIGVKDSFVAEKRLREEGLVLTQPTQRRDDPNAEAGSVVEQSPAAGVEVEEGASVSIVVADGESRVDVPRLQGLTRVKADERLREDGLELGETQPADAADTFIVKSQIPDAGLSVDRGTSVRVFLRKPPATSKQKATAKKKAEAQAKAKAKAAAAAKKKGGVGAGGGGAPAGITIPKFDGKPLGEYVAALGKLGLKANVVRAPASSKAGTVLATVPTPGKKAKKGDRVTVRASSGPPALAVQTATRVLFVSSVGGKELFRLPGAAAEPSYFPDGRQVVYRSGGRIVLAGTGKGAKPRTIYSGPDVLQRPTMASDGATLALIRREEGDGDLCFGRADVVDLGHLCLPDDGWDLEGRISWRDDGRAVLVSARRQSNRSVFAVRMYRASRPFAIDPLLWRGSTATSVKTPGKGVRAAVYSPGGSRVAAISNLESDGFEVVFANADDLALEQPKSTGTKACDVAWRSDGRELAAVQSDDACSQGLGSIVRFAPGKPKQTSPVTDKGRNPAYRPG